MCTVHSFPHNIDHCLTFARSEFEGLLEKSPSEANAFLSDPAKYLTAVRQVSACILLPCQHACGQFYSVCCSAGHSCGALSSSTRGRVSRECAVVRILHMGSRRAGGIESGIPFHCDRDQHFHHSVSGCSRQGMLVPRQPCCCVQSSDSAAREQLEKVVEVLDTERCTTFEDCIAWARHRFQVRHESWNRPCHTEPDRPLVSLSGCMTKSFGCTFPEMRSLLQERCSGARSSAFSTR